MQEQRPEPNTKNTSKSDEASSVYSEMEERLRESEERFHATFEQAAIGLLHVGIDGHVIRANQRFCDIIGCSPTEVEKKTIRDFTHPEDREEDLTYLREIIEGPQKQSYMREKRYMRSDGSWVWAHLTVAPVRDSQGKTLYLIGAVNDITEHKLLEQQAMTRARQLEAIFETITDGLIVYGPQGQVIQTNLATRHLLGLSPDFYQQSAQERAPAYDVRDEYGQHLSQDQIPFMRVLRGEVIPGSNAVDICLKLPEGREIQISISGAPMRDQNGSIVGAVCVFRDVTERRRLERRTEVLDAMIAIAEALVQTPENGATLEESLAFPSSELVMHRIAELTRRVLHAKRVSIISMEEEAQIIRSITVVGLSASQEQTIIEMIVGKHLLDLVGNPAIISHLKKQESFILDLNSLPIYESLQPYRSDKILLSPIFIDRRFIGLLHISHDDLPSLSNSEVMTLINAMTRLSALAIERERSTAELARLLVALHETNAQLEQVNRVQSDFISIVSHEFRTTLTSIQGFSELLSKEDFGVTEVKDYATDINTDAKRLNRMISDLLDLEHMKSGKMTLNLEAININATLMGVVERTRPNAPQHPIRLVLDETLPQIQADSDKLTQIVTNLMSNAIKYSPAGGEIHLTSRQEGNIAHVSIKDNGVGILAAKIEKIFVPYNRVDSENTRYIKGTGLGLSIVRQIVQMHGGRVWVESTPGVGSTFHFTLPLTDVSLWSHGE